MQYNLSLKETAGVLAVGLAMTAASIALSRRLAKTEESQQIAMYAAPALIYTAGVVIGTNRPKSGW